MTNHSEPSLFFDITDWTLEEAYGFLGISDTLSDGAVAVAFYGRYSGSVYNIITCPGWSVMALDIIARGRKSPLLTFILAIAPHITKENVALLVRQPNAPSTEVVKKEDIKKPTPINQSLTTAVAEVPQSSKDYGFLPTERDPRTPSDNESTSSPTISSGGRDMTSSSDADPSDNGSWASGKTASTGFDTSSDGESSAEADFEEPVGGKYWDSQSWRCEECNEELIDDKCPQGHPLYPCKCCGRNLVLDICAVCEECHDAF